MKLWKSVAIVLLATSSALLAVSASLRYDFECHPPTERRPGGDLGDCYVLDRWTGDVKRAARP